MATAQSPRCAIFSRPVSTARPPAASRPAPPAAPGPPRSRSGARRRSESSGSPVRADRVCSVEVGEHEDPEEARREERALGRRDGLGAAVRVHPGARVQIRRQVRPAAFCRPIGRRSAVQAQVPSRHESEAAEERRSGDERSPERTLSRRRTRTNSRPASRRPPSTQGIRGLRFVDPNTLVPHNHPMSGRQLGSEMNVPMVNTRLPSARASTARVP
jgi:hypothetical protein